MPHHTLLDPEHFRKVGYICTQSRLPEDFNEKNIIRTVEMFVCRAVTVDQSFVVDSDINLELTIFDHLEPLLAIWRMVGGSLVVVYERPLWDVWYTSLIGNLPS